MTTIRSVLVADSSQQRLTSEVTAALARVTGYPPVVLGYDSEAAGFSGCDVAVLVTDSSGVRAGLEALGRLFSSAPTCSIVVVGANLLWSEQLALLGAGAADIMSAPCSDDELKARVLRAAGLVPAVARNADARQLIHARINAVVGCSAAFTAILARLPVIAGCDARVLIQGETGTGKEICARAIHYLSARASRPWVAVNCAAIPSDLVESELFGHVRGAYTSAHAARAGLVREAEAGTLFLDDIDCLPLDAQAKLLRFLQEREYRQVGSNVTQRADVRVIAASNRVLRELVQRGGFRQDLYFRLNVLSLQLPALRERRLDIAPLALHFIREFAREFGRPTTALAPAALQKLLLHSWPGNVRELRHVIERAVVLSRGPLLNADELEVESGSVGALSSVQSFRAAKARVVQDFERGLIEQLLATHNGNVTNAARAAQKNRRAFFALMRKYAIDPTQFRAASRPLDSAATRITAAVE